MREPVKLLLKMLSKYYSSLPDQDPEVVSKAL